VLEGLKNDKDHECQTAGRTRVGGVNRDLLEMPIRINTRVKNTTTGKENEWRKLSRMDT